MKKVLLGMAFIIALTASVLYSSICFAETGYKPSIVESQDGKKYEIVETDAERVEKGGILSGGDSIKLGAIEAVQGDVRIKCYESHNILPFLSAYLYNTCYGLF